MRKGLFLAASALLFSVVSSGLSEEPPSYTIQGADRDRLLLDTGQWMRLIGVDMRNLASAKRPPHVFAEEVNRFLKALTGRTAFIELDDANAAARHREAGDILAYVYYLDPAEEIPIQGSPLTGEPILMVDEISGSSGGGAKAKVTPYVRRMLNAELVRRGYARADRARSFKYQEAFLAAEREAQQAHTGLWE